MCTIAILQYATQTINLSNICYKRSDKTFFDIKTSQSEIRLESMGTEVVFRGNGILPTTLGPGYMQ